MLHPGPAPQNQAQEAQNQGLPSKGKLGFPKGVPMIWSPDRQAEVGHYFGHPQNVQVNGLNFGF